MPRTFSAKGPIHEIWDGESETMAHGAAQDPDAPLPGNGREPHGIAVSSIGLDVVDPLESVTTHSYMFWFWLTLFTGTL